MTVVDSSVVVEYLAGEGVAAEVQRLLEREPSLPVTAPDVLVFEVLAAFRRHVRHRAIPEAKAAAAIRRLAGIWLDLASSLPLSRRAWELRDNFAVADALFVALAERLGEPLATKDQRLAAAARKHTAVEVIEL